MLDGHGRPVHAPPEFKALQFVYANVPAGRLFWLSQQVVSALEYWEEALLWVVLSGIWPSCENLHLYYRLRESYGDKRHLDQAPAHLVLRHEGQDLTTLVHLCMLFGWEVYIFTGHDYARVFISHDEYGEVAVPLDNSYEAFQQTVGSSGLKVQPVRSAV
jgi:hypothetical protein